LLSIPWYFSSQLKQGSLFGVLYSLITLSTLVWSLYAGALIDRHSRKKVFLGINIIGGIVLGSVAAAGYIIGHVPTPLVVLVFATTIYIYNIHYPSLYAFGQEISEKENYGKMNSYFEIQGQATSMLAGAVGAVLLSGTHNKMLNFLGINIRLPFDIEKWNLQDIFLMDFSTYLVAIILVSAIRYTPAEQLTVHAGKIMDRIKMGWDYLREHPLLFIFGNASHSIFVILLIEVHMLLPLYVNNHLHMGGDVYASAEIYYTFGALFAGVGIRQLFRKSNSVKAIIILMFVTTLVLVWAALTQSVLVFFIFSVIIGVTNAGSRILRITYLFNHIPNNMMGRTGSVFQAINVMLRVLFSWLFSLAFFTRGSNITWAYFIGGMFILISIIPLITKYHALLGKEEQH
jgi:DHA3 family macrolide efflux protein-like MFS transporter